MTACGVCGTAAQAPFRPPVPELAPDLDMRPGEPTRSTMNEWVRICPGCGAAAPDLATLRRDAVAIVRSVAYRVMDAIPESARPFVRWAMLCPSNERHEALLQAAWVADDIPDELAARDLRREAAAAWGDPADIESALRLVDVLRRAEAFDQAGKLAADLQTSPMDENSGRILAFQRARLASADSGRHLLSSALRPPARMPHVAHGKPKRAGFWGRLLGG
jgi:hypothetical protein